MSEIVFLVGEASEGGFSARALGDSLFIRAATTLEALREDIRDAIRCQFDEGQVVMRLHYVMHEVLAA